MKNDTISRQAAINTLCSKCAIARPETCSTIQNEDNWCEEVYTLLNLPSVQSTLYGYNIEHLKLIAEILQKENLSPERVAKALTDINRIVDIVRDEFEETLRKAVEQCTI